MQKISAKVSKNKYTLKKEIKWSINIREFTYIERKISISKTEINIPLTLLSLLFVSTDQLSPRSIEKSIKNKTLYISLFKKLLC